MAINFLLSTTFATFYKFWYVMLECQKTLKQMLELLKC
jgi:hypothetical protein